MVYQLKHRLVRLPILIDIALQGFYNPLLSLFLGCHLFIMLHEMVHLVERHDNGRFTELMDAFMPLWRLHRDELNHFPLGHEKWSY